MACLAVWELGLGEVDLGSLLGTCFGFLAVRSEEQHPVEQTGAVEAEPTGHSRELVAEGPLHEEASVAAGLHPLAGCRYAVMGGFWVLHCSLGEIDPLDGYESLLNDETWSTLFAGGSYLLSEHSACLVYPFCSLYRWHSPIVRATDQRG